MKVMMKCGHAANGETLPERLPVCVICVGLNAGANQVAEFPDLENRRARCTYYGSKCQSEIESSLDLAFFELRPEKEFDEFYCGCWGWN